VHVLILFAPQAFQDSLPLLAGTGMAFASLDENGNRVWLPPCREKGLK